MSEWTYHENVAQGQTLGVAAGRDQEPAIGARCHELRVNDAGQSWRIVYRIDNDAIVVADVFAKKTRSTPRQVIETCRRRLREYDDASS
jgi:phage-related protein